MHLHRLLFTLLSLLLTSTLHLAGARKRGPLRVRLDSLAGAAAPAAAAAPVAPSLLSLSKRQTSREAILNRAARAQARGVGRRQLPSPRVYPVCSNRLVVNSGLARYPGWDLPGSANDVSEESKWHASGVGRRWA